MNMLQITNLHPAIGNKRPFIRHLAAAALASVLLGACDGAATKAGDAAEEASGLLDPATLAQKLPPEARAFITAYERDLRTAAVAHVAEFGQLPASFADIASVATARTAAVTLLADGLGEQVPFASRATIEKAADGIVTATERRILAQMRTDNAPNP
jgi:hypothetical protein